MIFRVMILSWISAVFAAGFVEAKPDATPPDRSLSAIRVDVRDALRAEATTRRTGNNTREVLRLVDLYREMAAHPQRDHSATLKELGLQVRARLDTVRERIERRLSDPNRSRKNQKASPTIAMPETRVLAQQLPPPGAARVGQGAVVAGSPTVATIPTDFGPELVELIQATISPATWRINGGNGSIVYYAPLHVLVVSAPDEVHAQVGGVLRQLNAAQRQQDGAQVVAEVAGVRARE